MVNLIHLFISYNFVSADLSLEYIEEKVNAIFTGKNKVYKQKITNPVFGFLADKLGMVHNLRFYSPYLDVTDKEIKNEHIKFIEDSSQDPLTSLIIKLFPSPAGELTPSTTNSENPLSLFKINQAESVKFFAKLFVTLLKDEKNFDFKLVKANDKKSSMAKKKERVFEQITTKMLTEPQGNYFKDKDIRLLLIHAYIITALDPVINNVPNTSENQNEDLFEIYLTEILNGIQSIGGTDLPIIDKFILTNAIDKYNSLNYFPYSQLNQPLSNSLIPTYNRESDTFNYNKMFADCADISLLHICNCLFFLNGKYNLDHLPEASAELKNFYLKNQQIYTLKEEIRKEWSKVVQDLNPQKSENDNLESQYPTIKIQYNKPECANEVVPGIINMMNILIKITGLKKEEFLHNISLETISEKLEKLIERLSVRDDGKVVAKCVFNAQKFSESDSVSVKKDFFGIFKLTFSYKNGTEAEMEVKHVKFHTSVHFVSLSFESKLQKLTKDEICEKITTKDIVSKMLKSYLLENFSANTAHKPDFYLKYSIKTDLELNELTDENLFFNRFYLHGKINNNDIKKRYLLDFYRFIDAKKEKVEEISNGKKMLKLITRNLPLSDLGTYKEFKEFICIRSEYIRSDLNLLLNGNVLALLFKSECLNAMWNEIFTKEIPIIESVRIDTSSKIKILFPIFCSAVKCLPNLSNLQISTRELTTEKFQKIINDLNKFQKIREINISGPDYQFELPKNIGDLKSLEKLILYECTLNEQSETVGNLINLTDLDLTRCDFDESYLDNVLKDLTKLKYLSISLRNGVLKKFPISIKHLPKLRELLIDCKEFSSIPHECCEVIEQLERFVLYFSVFIEEDPKDGSIGKDKLRTMLRERVQFS